MVCSVASASTIMIATSPVSVTRPATTMSKTAFSSWLWVGNATQWPSIRATRTRADRAGERQAGELGGDATRR